MCFGGTGSWGISNSTVADNTAATDGGGILNNTGGSNTVTLNSVLLGDNLNPGSTSPDAYGLFYADHCLFTSISGITFSNDTNDQDGKPSGLTGVLGDFGGPTMTMPLSTTSVYAIDKGSAGSSVTYDQRGGDGSGPLTDFSRSLPYLTSTAVPDIGAYELSKYPFVAAKPATCADTAGTEQSYSRIASIQVVFDQPVSLTSTPTNAFDLRVKGSATDIVTFAVNGDPSLGPVTLTTFSGTTSTGIMLTEGLGSLIDNRYALTVIASNVTNSNGAMAANYPFDFTRFFGDANNNATVNDTDKLAFQIDLFNNMGRLRFDFNGDGSIGAADVTAFYPRYGHSLP
jgi:hypothetical protein